VVSGEHGFVQRVMYLNVSSWELSVLRRQLFARGSLFYFCPIWSHIPHQVSRWGCWSRAAHALAGSTQPLFFNSWSCTRLLQHIHKSCLLQHFSLLFVTAICFCPVPLHLPRFYLMNSKQVLHWHA